VGELYNEFKKIEKNGSVEKNDLIGILNTQDFSVSRRKKTILFS